MGIFDALKQQGYLEVIGGSSPSEWALTPQGWAKLDALEQAVSSKDNPAFVAMWYGKEEDGSKDEMDRLFSEGIVPGVISAGYRDPLRIDADKRDDYIMNKVLAAIRMAPFVVADYTGQRPGVYFEVGFARGLGIQVIHCCREDDFKNRHFDTQQLPHIRWKEPVELKERLSDWILGTLGHGPVRSKS